MNSTNSAERTELGREAVRITQNLIKIDTSNYGDGTCPGEFEAAKYVQEELASVGVKTEIVESGTGRPNIFVRVPGESKSALMIHGHLDAVPADPKDWSVDPFGGVIKDGYLWGRGAVDMKEMVGMMLAILKKLIREKTPLKRELLFGFVADEEAGGVNGMQWLVRNRKDIFEGCTEAISEVGGYSITLPTPEGPKRAYLVQTAEKGYIWGHLAASGRAGHGSIPNDDNAIEHLANAVVNITDHDWGEGENQVLAELIAGVEKITGRKFETREEFLDLLGGARPFVEATFSDSVNITTLKAGYMGNVIPSSATANFDCRYLPGRQAEIKKELSELAGEKVEVVVDHEGPAISAPRQSTLMDQMTAAIRSEDPEAYVLPYCLSAGTDNKWLTELGIDGYGFVPLKLPADYRFAEMFHGVDERVPVSAIEFGANVLWNLLTA